MLRFAFNTIGCADHALGDAIDLIGEAGYQAVVLTLNSHHMNPFQEGWEKRAEALRDTLVAADLSLVVDANARFLLNPRDRHEPSLLSADEAGRARRIEYISRAIKVCSICGGEAVTFTAGRAKRGVSQANAGVWLLDGLKQIAEIAAAEGVHAALEPEPGHIVATLDDYSLVRDTMKQMTDAPLRLSLDTGHVFITADRAPHQAVKEFAPILSLITVADMKRGEHAHLLPGEGDVAIDTVLQAAQDVGYEGIMAVKLPRDSFRADATIPDALDALFASLPSD